MPKKKTPDKVAPERPAGKTRNISLSETYESALFDLSHHLSQTTRKRVTISALIRLGIDRLMEMDEEDIIALLAKQ